MDIRKIGHLQPQDFDKSNKAQVGGGFREALEGLQKGANLGSVGFQTPALSPEGVKFSNHAVERMRTRGISFTPDDLQRLNLAVEKAAGKGSQNSLVLMGDNALVVSVKNSTVVTVMDKTSMKENVFTNIDSTVVM